jgi:hypothetical protein
VVARLRRAALMFSVIWANGISDRTLLISLPFRLAFDLYCFVGLLRSATWL